MILLAVLLPVVLIAAVGGGVLFLQGGVGGGPSVEVAENSDVPELSFPDPKKLDFSTLKGTSVDEIMESSHAFTMCDTIAKTMRARRYDLAKTNPESDGGSCRFYTPGMSLLSSGSIKLMADVGLWKGDSEAMYNSHLEAAGEQVKGDPDSRSGYEYDPIDKFRVGEEGFIQHSESVELGRSDAKAVFRSGDFLMLVSVWGSVYSPLPDADEKPLSKDITYREIIGIVKALSGDGKPSEPQIKEPDLKKHPALEGLTLPKLPEVEGRKAEAVCEELAAAANRIGIDFVSSDSQGGAASLDYSCGTEELWDQNADRKREFKISIGDFHSTSNIRPAGELGRDAQTLLRDTKGGKEIYTEPADAAMYALPFGDSGYAYYTDSGGIGRAYLAYAADDLYVKIELLEMRYADAMEQVPAKEKVLMKDLATFLHALS